MSQIVNNYLTAKKNLLWHFNCRQDYFVKSLVDSYWEILSEDDLHILRYHDSPEKISSAVIVRGGSGPLVYKSKDYTLVVAIDCVKTAFVLRNCLNMEKGPK